MRRRTIACLLALAASVLPAGAGAPPSIKWLTTGGPLPDPDLTHRAYVPGESAWEMLARLPR